MIAVLVWLNCRYNVKQVLELLEDEEFDYADIYIEPPDDGQQSEEDSEEEDSVGCINNLSGKQLQGLSCAKVSCGGMTSYIGLDNETDELSASAAVQSSTCLDASRRAHLGATSAVRTSVRDQSATNAEQQQSSTSSEASGRAGRGATSTDRRWVKHDLKNELPVYNLAPRHVIYSVDPVSLFESFFDDDVIQHLCRMTELYAHNDKGDHDFTVSESEMRCFLAILLLSGYIGLPRWRMMWEVGTETYLPAVAEAMRRNRFELIKRYMHCADNSHLPQNDKFAKMRSLMCLLNERYLANAMFEENLCIDESMSPYFGRHGAKQFLKGKPIRFGYKFWCLCNRLGYLIQFEPYQGSGEYDRSLGLGPSVILDLISELPANVSFKLYADRFFSSLKLVDRLSTLGFGYTGTVMSNRIENCPVTSQYEMSRKSRGDYDYRLDKTTNSLVVVWNDNRVVTVVSNTNGVSPVRPVLRWVSSEKRKVPVNQPHVVHQYNMFMGGVDRMDQNVDNYRVGIRSKKWWWPVLLFCIDTSVHNAWQLYRRSDTHKVLPLDYLGFRRHIVSVYLKKYGVQSAGVGRPCNSIPRSSKALSKRIPDEVRFDSSDHWLTCAYKQNRCAVCSKNTMKMCSKCCVNLHELCFPLFHSANGI